jgi:hypothetical protein
LSGGGSFSGFVCHRITEDRSEQFAARGLTPDTRHLKPDDILRRCFIQEKLGGFTKQSRGLPVDRYPDFFLIAIAKNQVFFLATKLKQIPRQFYIHFTVLDDVVNAALFPPPQGLQPICRLIGVQRLLRQVGQ